MANPYSVCDVRLSLGSVRFTSGSRPAQRCPRSSGVDPQETLALPQKVEHRSLTTRREKLVKIGAKVDRHGRYVTFQLAEFAIPRDLFADIMRRIDRLRPKPVPA